MDHSSPRRTSPRRRPSGVRPSAASRQIEKTEPSSMSSALISRRDVGREKKQKQNIFGVISRVWNKMVGHGKGRMFKAYIYSFFIHLVLGLSFTAFMMYGPIGFLREIWITSAMTTYSHKYLATWFFSEETIKEVMGKNTVENLSGTTDLSQIVVKEEDCKLELHDVSRDGYKAWMLEISDPSWVRLGVGKNFGTKGSKLPYIVTDYNALAGINAGGFADAGGAGNGGTPVGMVVLDGETIHNNSNKHHNIVGFNKDNILVLGKFTNNEIKALNLRDAVEFTPFLIINGEPAKIKGNGGWGIAPRTAIGQRKDGTVLFLVIDGRSASSLGASIKTVQELMIEFDAYNAANLDGGSSTVLMYEDEVINNPSGSDADGMRFLPNAFLVIDPDKYELPDDRPPISD